jgi:XTP/dITP diphosphohydrolase
MMKRIIFATNNRHKLEEVQHSLGDAFELVTLKEVGIVEDIPETGETLEENASQKSHYVFDRLGEDCFADDTGLEVVALNGAPGVHSARYASLEKSDSKNIDLLLKNLSGKLDRSARFRTVISLILNGQEYLFEGIVNGRIIEDRRGCDGFGYDPIFVPDGCDRTFAEMSMEEKNQISHRGRAVAKLVEFLKQYRSDGII